MIFSRYINYFNHINNVYYNNFPKSLDEYYSLIDIKHCICWSYRNCIESNPSTVVKPTDLLNEIEKNIKKINYNSKLNEIISGIYKITV